MDIEADVADDSGEESHDEWEQSSACVLVWNDCGAFFAIILLIVLELTSEGNAYAALLIGGVLCVVNVGVTATRLDRMEAPEARYTRCVSLAEKIGWRKDVNTVESGADELSTDLEAARGNGRGRGTGRVRNQDRAARKSAHSQRHARRMVSHGYERSAALESDNAYYSAHRKQKKWIRKVKDDKELEESGEKKSRKRRVRMSRRERPDVVRRHGERELQDRRVKDKSKRKKKRRVTIGSESLEQVVTDKG